jgi:hypothetical protein
MAAQLMHTLDYPTASKYTHDDREQAVIFYLMFGNFHKVSEVIQIPMRTIQGWSKTAWWGELITQTRVAKRQELESNLGRIIDKSMQTIEKSLEFQEVKARDAATILGICFDKRQILNHQPTSITSTHKISDLAQQFEDYIQAKQVDGVVAKD